MASKTIVIRGDFMLKEIVATGAITPGMFVDLDGAVTAAGSGRKAVALENDLVGEGIDDAYASGDTVRTGLMRNGAEVYAWLAAGQSVAVGDPLQVDAAGRMIDLGAGALVAFALETIDNSATGAVPVRIKVEIA